MTRGHHAADWGAFRAEQYAANDTEKICNIDAGFAGYVCNGVIRVASGEHSACPLRPLRRICANNDRAAEKTPVLLAVGGDSAIDRTPTRCLAFLKARIDSAPWNPARGRSTLA
jgi:hypothetical protein